MYLQINYGCKIIVLNSLGSILYRMPEEKEIWNVPILKINRIPFIGLDLSIHQGFIFAPYDKGKDTILYTIGKKEQQIHNSQETTIFNEIDFPALVRQNYIENVSAAIEKIKNSDLEKVVIATQVEFPQQIKPKDLFHKLCSKYPHAFLYLIDGVEESWIGASPEMLVRYQEGEGKTVALAGTQDKRNKTWGDKEKVEQLFIQSYIVDKMKNISGLSFEKGDTRTIRAGEIEHISSIFNFKTNTNGLTNLVKALHPTPAVCGHPEDLAHKFILTKEGIERSYYTGFLGFSQEDRTDLFVNLRCAKLSKQSVTLYAGAGITADSIPEKEWEEVCKKMNTLGLM